MLYFLTIRPHRESGGVSCLEGHSFKMYWSSLFSCKCSPPTQPFNITVCLFKLRSVMAFGSKFPQYFLNGSCAFVANLFLRISTFPWRHLPVFCDG